MTGMKKPKIALLIITAIIAVGGAVVFTSGEDVTDADVENQRDLASTLSEYEAMNACDKQAALWRQIKATEYKALPDLKGFGVGELWDLGQQSVGFKGKHHSDFAPKGWRKLLHARGSIATIRVVPRPGTPFTGIFQGADCALLRLSLTFKPGFGRGVAPGLALKVLRDRNSSANVSALVSLTGQGKDYDFFLNPLSNIVPIASGLGPKIIHNIFGKVSSYPEELAVNDMATTDVRGARAQQVVSPRQLFFVPATGLKSSSDEHDIRSDFAKIPAGTTVYHLMAAPTSRANFNYVSYSDDDAKAFVKEAQHIADLVTTSEFVASSFGDSGIFFRHELR